MQTTIKLLLALGIILGATAAIADGIQQKFAAVGTDGISNPTLTGGGPPPTCSNSFDFSDGCNSQYLGAL